MPQEPLAGSVGHGLNPSDPLRKPNRPAILLWVHEGEALVVFGQTYESGTGPYFTVRPTPGRSFVNRPTHFYLSDVAKLSVDHVRLAGFRLNKGNHKLAVKLLESAGLPSEHQPPAGASKLWPGMPEATAQEQQEAQAEQECPGDEPGKAGDDAVDP